MTRFSRGLFTWRRLPLSGRRKHQLISHSRESKDQVVLLVQPPRRCGFAHAAARWAEWTICHCPSSGPLAGIGPVRRLGGSTVLYGRQDDGGRLRPERRPGIQSCGPQFSNPIYYTGVVLNNPADMLSTAADYNTTPFDLGGQWQTFVQTVNVNNDGDYGGVAVYAGQNYGNIPDTGLDPTRSYANADWNANVQRLDSYPLDPTIAGTGSPYPVLPYSGYRLQAGDWWR